MPQGSLVFGGAPIGGLYAPVSDGAAAATLQAAWDAGIRAFDTAPHYGVGLSERRIGDFLAGRQRAGFVVSTQGRAAAGARDRPRLRGRSRSVLRHPGAETGT